MDAQPHLKQCKQLITPQLDDNNTLTDYSILEGYPHGRFQLHPCLFSSYLSELCRHIVLQIFGRFRPGVLISTLQPTDKLLQHSGCA